VSQQTAKVVTQLPLHWITLSNIKYDNSNQYRGEMKKQNLITKNHLFEICDPKMKNLITIAMLYNFSLLNAIPNFLLNKSMDC
jgi:hypothetical protein